MNKRIIFILLTVLCAIKGWSQGVTPAHYSTLAEGRFFLYNVSQGMYLKSSDNPPVMATSARMVTLSRNADGTTWQIASGHNGKYLKIGVYKGQYLWSNGSEGDTSWSIEAVADADGVYNISTSAFTETNAEVKDKTMYLTGSNASATDSEDNQWAFINQDAYIDITGGLTAEYRSVAPTTADTYYLYDVMNKQYLRTDTRALTAEPAAPVTVTPVEGGFTLSGESGKYLKIGVWKGQYLWSNGSESSTVWTIEQADAENVFYIYTDNFTESSSEVAGKTMYLTGTNASATKPAYGQWALVTPQQYAAARWQSFDRIAAQATDRTAYDKAVGTALSGLASATTDAERAALDADVWTALCRLLKEVPARDGRYDITALLQNPTFDASASGWTSTHTVNWSSTGVAELFNRTSNTLSQTLAAMPAGSYTMKVQAFYRPTDYVAASSNYEWGTDVNSAVMFFGDATHAIWNINDEGRYRRIHSSDVAGADQRSIPFSLGGAHAAFDAGLYWNVLRTTLAADGDVALGLRFADGQATNWMPFDNFCLYYSPSTATASVTLSTDEAYTLAEDTYADVTLTRTFAAGQKNALCLPFDLDACQVSSHFTNAYAIADVTDATATLVPVTEMRAGGCYLVEVDADATEMTFTDVLLRTAAPDVLPVIWEGATQQGSYDGYTFTLTLADGTSTAPSALTLAPIDFADVRFSINLENANARAYLNNTTYTESSSSRIGSYKSIPPARSDQPQTVRIPVPAQEGIVTLTLSNTADYADASTFTFAAGTTLCELRNLLPQQTYYFKAEADGSVIALGQFTTEGRLRMVKASTVSNIRDLGGWLTADGNRLRYGRIYRGGEMNGGHVMSAADREELLRLGIGAELDLRYDTDISAYGIASSALGKEAPYEYLNINEYGSDALADYTEQFARTFRFTLDNLRDGRAVYFHCIWGADRTGCYAMLLEGLLGLPVDQLYKDYELTSYSIAGSRTKGGLDSKLNYIKALDGSTLQMKFFNYWRTQVGIAATDLLDFIDLMTDGTSQLTTTMTIDEAATAAPTATELANVTLTRTLTPAIWNTFCVPFALTAGQIAASPLKDAIICGFSSSDATSITFASSDVIEAGVPYLVRLAGEAAVTNPSFEGVEVVATEGQTCGDEGSVQFIAQPYDKALPASVCYLATDGKVKRLAEGGSIKGLRAYFRLPATTTEVKLNIGGVATSIDEIENGKLRMENLAGAYDLSGRRVSVSSVSYVSSVLPKGVYIVSGKKVIIK